MRIILKISGEYLKGDNNISNSRLEKVLNNIKELKDDNELLIVVGGGNFWRGRNDLDIDDNVSDYLGMLGTSMNALAISSYLNNKGIDSTCYNSFLIENIISKEDFDKVLADLNNKKIVVFGGGLGYGGITTDMTTITLAERYNSDLILMAKNIDGIYDKDPKEDGAQKLNTVTVERLCQILNNNYTLFDKAFIDKLKEYKIEVYVYHAEKVESIKEVIDGKSGTKITC